MFRNLVSAGVTGGRGLLNGGEQIDANNVVDLVLESEVQLKREGSGFPAAANLLGAGLVALAQNARTLFSAASTCTHHAWKSAVQDRWTK